MERGAKFQRPRRPHTPALGGRRTHKLSPGVPTEAGTVPQRCRFRPGKAGRTEQPEGGGKRSPKAEREAAASSCTPVPTDGQAPAAPAERDPHARRGVAPASAHPDHQAQSAAQAVPNPGRPWPTEGCSHSAGPNAVLRASPPPPSQAGFTSGYHLGAPSSGAVTTFLEAPNPPGATGMPRANTHTCRPTPGLVE